MRFIGLLMVAGVIGFSHSAEGQEQDLGGGQGVIWVEGGVDSEVPENAIRVRVGDGWPLCRGTLAEDRGQGNFWRDIGVVKPRDGKCHTLRAKEELRLQENFYYLVPAETDGEVSMGDMVLEADVEARIAEATAQLEADLEAAHNQIQRFEGDAAYLAEATAQFDADMQAAHDQTQGMFSEADVEARIAEATEGMYSEDELQAQVAAATENIHYQEWEGVHTGEAGCVVAERNGCMDICIPAGAMAADQGQVQMSQATIKTLCSDKCFNQALQYCLSAD